jgi:hypothetical protein
MDTVITPPIVQVAVAWVPDGTVIDIVGKVAVAYPVNVPVTLTKVTLPVVTTEVYVAPVPVPPDGVTTGTDV